MTNPTLVRTSVKLVYTASDKCRMEFGAKGGVGTQNRATGEQVHPHAAIIAGIDELARIAELFGFGDEAEAAVLDARKRVKEWSKQ